MLSWTEGKWIDSSSPSVQPRMALENRAEGQALPVDSGQDALFWSVLGHSVSTSASFVVHGPETAPDAVLPLSVSPSSAPKEDKKKSHVISGQPELSNPTPKDQLLVAYFQLLCQAFFFFFQLVYCFLIPAPCLCLEITGSTRDNSWLLEKGSIQGHCL